MSIDDTRRTSPKTAATSCAALYVEYHNAEIFVWPCLQGNDLDRFDMPFACVRRGESFCGLSYDRLALIAATRGWIDAAQIAGILMASPTDADLSLSEQTPS